LSEQSQSWWTANIIRYCIPNSSPNAFDVEIFSVSPGIFTAKIILWPSEISVNLMGMQEVIVKILGQWSPLVMVNKFSNQKLIYRVKF